MAFRHFATTALVGAGIAIMGVGVIVAQPAPPATDQRPQQPDAPRGKDPQAERPRGPMMSPEDRAAYAEARIAALKAGLRLTAEQQALWPPVEAALKRAAEERSRLIEARRDQPPPADPVERLRRASERAEAQARILKSIVEAVEPLHRALDDNQKRRLGVLMAMLRPGPRFAGPPMPGPDRFGFQPPRFEPRRDAPLRYSAPEREPRFQPPQRRDDWADRRDPREDRRYRPYTRDDRGWPEARSRREGVPFDRDREWDRERRPPRYDRTDPENDRRLGRDPADTRRDDRTDRRRDPGDDRRFDRPPADRRFRPDLGDERTYRDSPRPQRRDDDSRLDRDHRPVADSARNEIRRQPLKNWESLGGKSPPGVRDGQWT